MADSQKYIDHTNGGKEITGVDPKQVDFLVSQGYISPVGGNKDDFGRTATAPAAKDDPTLAANREAPVPNDQLEPHIANADQGAEKRETTVGKHLGLDAKPAAGSPDVKVKPNAKAGK